MPRHRLWLTVLALAFAALLVARIWLPGETSAQARSALHPTHDVTVVRGDLNVTANTTGTWGHSPIEAQPLAEQGGVVTALPDVGTVVSRGGMLYAIDNVPTFALYGDVPEWRSLSIGVPDGPDIAELESNLVALGLGAAYGLHVNGHFDWADAMAVRAFHVEHRMPPSMSWDFGQSVFVPGAVVVTKHAVALGAVASPGGNVVQVAGQGRIIQAASPPGADPTSLVGHHAAVLTPQGQITGTITKVVAKDASTAADQPSDPGATTASLLIAVESTAATLPEDGARVSVVITVSTQPDVLTVPVTAVVALVEGGYALEVRASSGATHLVHVDIGAIDDATAAVAVYGPDVTAGTRVVVAGPSP